MSNNLHLITILKSERFGITREALLELQRTITDRPESSFLDDDCFGLEMERPDHYVVDSVQWYGECSGSTYESFEKALAAFEGEADLAIIWENGLIGGVRLKNGVVTAHEVLMSLGDEE